MHIRKFLGPLYLSIRSCTGFMFHTMTDDHDHDDDNENEEGMSWIAIQNVTMQWKASGTKFWSVNLESGAESISPACLYILLLPYRSTLYYLTYVHMIPHIHRIEGRSVAINHQPSAISHLSLLETSACLPACLLLRTDKHSALFEVLKFKFKFNSHSYVYTASSSFYTSLPTIHPHPSPFAEIYHPSAFAKII